MLGGMNTTEGALQGESRDFDQVRQDFPIAKRRAYLNNASIGPVSNRVFAAVQDFLADVRDNGRNNYPHWCRHADTAIKDRIGKLMGADRSEIAFIKNTTEGLAIVANGIDWRPGDNVIVPDIEYPSNVYCCMNLQHRGVEVRWVKNRQGRILVDDLRALIDSRTRLVSISSVQFSNGFRHDVASTAELCRDRGVLLSLDAIQWVGALHLDLSAVPVDFLATGGHKWMLAPIGTGIFYCSKDALDKIRPSVVGYHSVDKGEDHMDYGLDFRPNAGRFEEALVNFPGIYGLDAAVQTLLELGTERVERHVLALAALGAEAVQRKGYEILSPWRDGERSGILSFRHPGLPADQIAQRMNAAGVDLAVRAGALRISPSYYNNDSDIMRMAEALP
jgi:selenocysteine lyase/cysteine desulfurase